MDTHNDCDTEKITETPQENTTPHSRVAITQKCNNTFFIAVSLEESKCNSLFAPMFDKSTIRSPSSKHTGETNLCSCEQLQLRIKQMCNVHSKLKASVGKLL